MRQSEKFEIVKEQMHGLARYPQNLKFWAPDPCKPVTSIRQAITRNNCNDGLIHVIAKQWYIYYTGKRGHEWAILDISDNTLMYLRRQKAVQDHIAAYF